MSRLGHGLFVASLMFGFLSACSEPECEEDRARPCYTGPQGTSGVGLCRDGLQRCVDGKWESQCVSQVLPSEERCDLVDNDCDGVADEEVRNACGGCARLPGAPGEGCPGCGTWACDGTEALICVPPEHAIGSECQNDTCFGVWGCNAEGLLECATPRMNACGVCGGTDVPDIGESCQNAAGCEGVFECNALGTNSVCDAPQPNNCGACGEPNVPGIDGPCIAGGCSGTLRCSQSGGSVCDAPTKNNCGTCGAADIPDVGNSCGAGACAGTYTCNAAGTGAVCVFPGMGSPCEGEGVNGCPGIIQCDETGENTACIAPARNACGTCGGPEVTGIGDACTTSFGCEGTLRCNGAGTASVCVPDEACLPTTTHVVISEVAGRGPNGDADEFIELYNPTNEDVSLNGWVLWYRKASSTTGYTTLFKFPASATIKARGYVLVGYGGTRGYVGSVTADYTYTAVQIANESNHIFLTNTSSAPSSETAASVVDAIGWGTVRYSEGGSAAPKQAAAPNSIERKAHEGSSAASMTAGGSDEQLGNGFDTDNNGNDFIMRALRDPQNSASPTEPFLP